MATERFANDVQTNLVGDIDSAVTTITVASASGFPTQPQFRVRISNEFLLVTGGAGTTTWTVTRGIEGSTAAAHTDGIEIVHVVTAGAIGTNSDPAGNVPGLRSLGTGATQAASGADARLSDARAPLAHKATHEPGGTDAMNVDAAAGTGSLRTLGTGATQAAAGSHTHTESQVTGLVGDLAAKEAVANKDTDGTLAANSDTKYASQKATKTYVDGAVGAGGANASDSVKGITKLSTAPVSGTNPIAVGDNDPRNSNSRSAIAHATSHQPGGSDAMAVDAAAGVGSLRTLGGGATQAAAGNDPRFATAGGTEVVGGTADDTAAFQAALTTGRVNLAKGVTYTVTAMTLSSNTVIEGNGATVLRKGGGSPVTGDIFSNAAAVTNVTVRNATFDNNHAATGNYMFRFRCGSSNVNLNYNSFINHDFATVTVRPVSEGPGSTASTNFRFTDNRIVGSGVASNRGSIECYDTSWVWFERNYCENHNGFKDEAIGATGGVMHHIFCRDNLFRNVDAMCLEIRNNDAAQFEDVVISGNQAYNIGATIVGGKGLCNVGEHVDTTAAPGAADDKSYARRITVTGNVVKGFRGYGCAFGGGETSGGDLGAHVEDVVVADNVFDGTDASGVPEIANGSIGIYLADGVSRFSVTGNKVRGTGLSGIRVAQQTDKTPQGRGSITGNDVSECCQRTSGAPAAANDAGIYFLGAVNDITVTGNTSRDHGSASAANCAGIGTDTHTSGTGAAGLVIANNRCYDTRGTKYQTYGIRLGHVASATTIAHPSFCTVTNNDVRGNLTGGIHVYALDTTSVPFRNHTISNNLGANEVANASKALGSNWGSVNTEIHVKDYAVGDGAADDTAAFQAAVNDAAAAGVPLYVDPGYSYLINGTVDISTSYFQWIQPFAGFNQADQPNATNYSSKIVCGNATGPCLRFGHASNFVQGHYVDGLKVWAKPAVDRTFRAPLVQFGRNNVNGYSDLQLRNGFIDGRNVDGDGIKFESPLSCSIHGTYIQNLPGGVGYTIVTDAVNTGNITFADSDAHQCPVGWLLGEYHTPNSLMNSYRFVNCKAVGTSDAYMTGLSRAATQPTNANSRFIVASWASGGAAGQKTVTVADATGLAVGQIVTVCKDASHLWVDRISALSGTLVTLTNNIPAALASGDKIIAGNWHTVSGSSNQVRSVTQDIPHWENCNGFLAHGVKGVTINRPFIGNGVGRGVFANATAQQIKLDGVSSSSGLTIPTNAVLFHQANHGNNARNQVRNTSIADWNAGSATNPKVIQVDGALGQTVSYNERFGGIPALLGVWHQDNPVAISQTNVQLAGPHGSSSRAVRVPHYGALVGIQVALSSALTAGGAAALVATVYKNGSATALTCTLDSTTNTTVNTTEFENTTVTLAPNDRVDVRITTSGTLAPTANNVDVTVWVEQ